MVCLFMYWVCNIQFNHLCVSIVRGLWNSNALTALLTYRLKRESREGKLESREEEALISAYWLTFSP